MIMNNDLDSVESRQHDLMRQGLSFTAGSAAEKNAFLGNMGHELRNPLTNIIAHVETLVEGVYGPLQEAQKDALTAIHDSARHLLQLVTDVVDLGRIDTGNAQVTQTACVISKKCSNSMAMVAALAQTRSIHIVFEVQPPRLRVAADPRRLQQIITELLSAAVLSAPIGDQVRLYVTADGDVLHLQTLSGAGNGGTDAGPSDGETDGMPQQLLSRLEKVKPIGLALLQKWVHLQGGSFAVREAVGSKVSMSIHLPVNILPEAAPALDASVHESPGRTELPAPAPSQSATILIADDQPALITVTRNYLESLGFNVITARDGSEAVQRAVTLQPDLILMDVRMPVVDGLSAIRQIRASTDPKTRDIAIVSLSGHAGAADQEKCLAAGATAYLSKPFGVRELDRIIADYVRPRGN